MTDKPKWNGSFEQARRDAIDIVGDHSDDHNMMIEKIAEALVEAWDSGAAAERNLRGKPHMKRIILAALLREHGIGIATLDEVKAHTLAVARGEFKIPTDEPKLWFSSIEVLAEKLKKSYGMDK